MLQRVAEERVADYLSEAQHSAEPISENYHVENLLLAPSVTLVVTGGALEFSASYVVDHQTHCAVGASRPFQRSAASPDRL
jgi:hypothetical protein